MRLTMYTDYALRVLIYLGTQSHDKISTIQEISDVYQISKNHLTKVVHQLGKLDYIETVRGRNGGIKLKPSVLQISIGEIIRQTEDDFHLVECFRADHTCTISPVCQLQHTLHQALQAYFQVLDAVPLQKVIGSPEQYTAIFQDQLNRLRS